MSAVLEVPEPSQVLNTCEELQPCTPKMPFSARNLPPTHFWASIVGDTPLVDTIAVPPVQALLGVTVAIGFRPGTGLFWLSSNTAAVTAVGQVSTQRAPTAVRQVPSSRVEGTR